MKSINSKQLLEWFDISRYELVASFDLARWYRNLSPRKFFYNLPAESLKKYREDFRFDFSDSENLLTLWNECEDEWAPPSDWYFATPQSRLYQATVQSLPASYSAWAADRAKAGKEETSGPETGLSAIDVEDETQNSLEQPADLIERMENKFEHDPFLHLQVNMFAPDSLIIDNFKEWLKSARDVFEMPSRNLFTLTDMESWAKFQILPFIDLTVWARLEDVRISDPVMGNVLFSNEYDVSLSERVAKVVRPKAKWLTRPSVVNAIWAQHSNME